MAGVELRALMPGDGAAAGALLDAAFTGTRYHARMREMFDAALQFEDPEYLVLLAEVRGKTVAVAMFGTVAGARQCSKFHALVGDVPHALAALADAVVQVCANAGERLVVAELPDEPSFDHITVALQAAGFRSEGFIESYVADGISLRMLVWRPAPLV